MTLEELVEDLMTIVPLNPGGARRESEEAVLTDQVGDHPLFSHVGRVRTDDLPALADRARAFFADRGRSQFVWFLGPSRRPVVAAEQLFSLGARHLSSGTALVLTEEPASGPAVDVREVVDLRTAQHWEEVAEVERVAQAPGTARPPSRAAELLEAIRQTPGRSAYVAYLDDEPVSAAGLVLTDRGIGVLAGGATVPGARGRGIYTALVAHRWKVAAAAGVPALGVHASDMSRPVLEKVGFRVTAHVDVLQMPVDSRIGV